MLNIHIKYDYIYNSKNKIICRSYYKFIDAIVFLINFVNIINK